MADAVRRRLDEGREETSLDLLENEDRRILDMSEQLGALRRTSVEERAEYGNVAKLLVRHFAVREAALVDVADGLRQVPELKELADGFAGDPAPRRRGMDAVEKMARGIPGIDLNSGQDFDGELSALLAVLRPDLEWDIGQGIPKVRASISPDRAARLFHAPHHVLRHAPTNLHPGSPRWWERAPVVSRVITIVQHLRDYPRATRDART